eukprot:m.114422 g.114422  ORF g.114422 m.114422 type:complete len:89 (+) comp12820_c0_seq7:3347-3613(+)
MQWFLCLLFRDSPCVFLVWKAQQMFTAVVLFPSLLCTPILLFLGFLFVLCLDRHCQLYLFVRLVEHRMWISFFAFISVSSFGLLLSFG